MSLIVDVNGDKTFGETDGGILQHVTATVTVTIAVDSNYKFLTDDWIDIFNDSTGVVTINGQDGMTISSKGNKIIQNGYARFTKIADNKWIGWGDFST